MNSTKNELIDIYNTDLTENEKLAKKTQELLKLRHSFEKKKLQWDGGSEYDFWFETPLSNATFAPISTYSSMVELMQEFLESHDRSLPVFYSKLIELARDPHAMKFFLSNN